MIVLKKDNKEFIKSNILVLKPQQRFKSERHNVFTEEIIKIAFSLNDDKKMQAIDSIGTYAHGTSKDLVSEKEEIKCNNTIKWYKNHKWCYKKTKQKKTTTKTNKHTRKRT